MARTWTRNDIVKIFEYLLEQGSKITSHHTFRGLLDRNRNLFANQVTRESNGNIAYRSVDFDVTSLADDKEFWARIDNSKYNELIEDNAAGAIVKMAEKLDIIQ